jgi:exodeoxyribonuclease VII large subunit
MLKSRNTVPGVTEITWRIKDLLEGEFTGITVSGEVSQPTTSANGHIYFTLKDDGASIACVAWRSTVQRMKGVPAHGEQVNVMGDVQVYPPSGRYQIVVKSIEQAGAGALQQAFERLKQKLEAEGLFDAERKRSLPRFPKSIGVVTSETGAAFQDIRSTLQARYPLAVVKLYHAAVQGVGAASEIARGISRFSEVADVDVLIVGRGGGSLEDLWPFNEEVVARAIAACTVPVISAVGHETDFSISDFVADVRAATPTQAAVIATPSQDDLRLAVVEWERRVETVVRGGMERSREKVQKLLKTHALLVVRDKLRFHRDSINRHHQQLEFLIRGRIGALRQISSSLSKHTGPNLQIRVFKERKLIELLDRRRETIMRTSMVDVRDLWRELHHRLVKVDPTEPLNRGFTRILQQGSWIRTKASFDTGSKLTIHWKDGSVETQINTRNNT